MDISKYTDEIESLKAERYESNQVNTDLKVEMEGLERERDFYFEKLREIEVMLQEIEDKGEGTDLTNSIFKILYATIDGFEPANQSTPAVIDDAETY